MTEEKQVEPKVAETKIVEPKAEPKVVESKFKVNDRVRRTEGEGCVGTITSIREEISSTNSPEMRERSKLVYVQWDNGTASYFTPSGLTVAQ